MDELPSHLAPLPQTHDFCLGKVSWRIRRDKARKLALQLPEGLIIYGPTIAYLIQKADPSVQEVVVLGDTAYGACCLADVTALALGADLLVHFGHSCLVDIADSTLPCLYIHVPIAAEALSGNNNLADASDVRHVTTDLTDMSLVESSPNLSIEKTNAMQEFNQRIVAAMESLYLRDEVIALCATVQYVHLLPQISKICEKKGSFLTKPIIPQAWPLSDGELLGCTSPKVRQRPPGSSPESLAEYDASYHYIDGIFFLGDGRFHLESILTQCPGITAYRYDPFAKIIQPETFAFEEFIKQRQALLANIRQIELPNLRLGIVLSTLGRQGNVQLLIKFSNWAREAKIAVTEILVGELCPDFLVPWESKLDAVVPLGCPRLAMDWGKEFSIPMLTPYELYLLIRGESLPPHLYPMDWYRKDCGPWANHSEKRCSRVNRRLVEG